MKQIDYSNLEQVLGYKFTNQKLLKQALVRKSAIDVGLVPEDTGHYQTLAFLGDKALGFVIGDILIENNPDYEVGQLTEETKRLVKNKDGPLCGIAKKLGVEEYIIMSVGEEIADKGKKNQKTLASTMEAILGAIFLDSGRNYNLVKNFVNHHWYGLEKQDKSDIFIAMVEKSIIPSRYFSHEEFSAKFLKAITNGADVRRQNKDLKTVFHLLGPMTPVELIISIQPNLDGINLEGVDEHTFQGYKYLSNFHPYSLSINLHTVSFRDANLQGINFSSCIITNVNFTDANLRNVNFSSVKFSQTNFTGADLRNANFSNCIMDAKTKLSYLQAVKAGRADRCLLYAEFWEAIVTNDIDRVYLCIECQIDINIVSDHNLLTALHIAAGFGYKEITDLLLKNGADPNIQAIKPLYNVWIPDTNANWQRFRNKGNFSTIGNISVLLGQESIGATPLHLAAGNGHITIVQTLLSYGADISKNEWYGINPRDLATQNGHVDIASLLYAEEHKKIKLRDCDEASAECKTSPTPKVNLPPYNHSFCSIM